MNNEQLCMLTEELRHKLIWQTIDQRNRELEKETEKEIKSEELNMVIFDRF